jgi:hypothetical protein
MQSRKRVLLLFICAIVTSQTIPLAIPTTIVPPANPANPATVNLIDYGKTPQDSRAGVQLVLGSSVQSMIAWPDRRRVSEDCGIFRAGPSLEP